MVMSFGDRLEQFRFVSPTKSTGSPIRTSPIKRESPRSLSHSQSQSNSTDEDGSDDVYDNSEGQPITIALSRKKRKATKKVKKQSSVGYVPPAAFEHLSPLTDVLASDLEIVWCGINPGVASATHGHHYAHPTNHFWKCLSAAGFTPRLYAASEGTLLLDLKFGLTNLVDRPTANASQLSERESIESVPAFLSKLDKYRPKICSLNGMGIAVTILKYLKTRPSHPPNALVPASSQADQKSSPIKSAAGESKKSNISTVAAIGFLPIKISFPPTPSFMTIVKKQEEESEGAIIGEVERERDVVFFHCLPSSSGLVTQYQLIDKKLLFKRLAQDSEIICGRSKGVVEGLREEDGVVEFRMEDLVDNAIPHVP